MSTSISVRRAALNAGFKRFGIFLLSGQKLVCFPTCRSTLGAVSRIRSFHREMNPDRKRGRNWLVVLRRRFEFPYTEFPRAVGSAAKFWAGVTRSTVAPRVGGDMESRDRRGAERLAAKIIGDFGQRLVKDDRACVGTTHIDTGLGGMRRCVPSCRSRWCCPGTRFGTVI